MTPESKLNWSTEIPLIEDVIGKTVLYEWKSVAGNRVEICFISNDAMFVAVFVGEPKVIRYTILDLPDLTPAVEPIALWGKLPEIVREGFADIHFAIYKSNDYCIELPYCGTRELAILAWNRIATVLNEVER